GMATVHTMIDSPIGELTLVGTDEAIVAVYMENHSHQPDVLGLGPRVTLNAAPLVIASAAEQLNEYFAGTRTTFEVPHRPAGTDFQRAVWQWLSRIPYGETWSYSRLAREVGDIGAVRAVASANARNPLSIIVPCHRVIGSDGTLVGYGGGLDRKRF